MKSVRQQYRNPDSQDFSFLFPATVNCSVEHVILNVACSLEDEDTVNVDKYCLRVWGLAEYLAPNTTLAQYEYIHQCIKLEKDIELAIMTKAQMKRSIARTVNKIFSTRKKPVITITYTHKNCM